MKNALRQEESQCKKHINHIHFTVLRQNKSDLSLIAHLIIALHLTKNFGKVANGKEISRESLQENWKLLNFRHFNNSVKNLGNSGSNVQKKLSKIWVNLTRLSSCLEILVKKYILASGTVDQSRKLFRSSLDFSGFLTGMFGQGRARC